MSLETKHAYGPNWIYFGKVNIPYYQKDTEPKAFPDSYIVMVPAEMADRVVDGVQEKLDLAVEALKEAHSEIHSEFCGDVHHVNCSRITETLRKLGIETHETK